MEVLEYYDDERVKRESGFLNKNLFLMMGFMFIVITALFALRAISLVYQDEKAAEVRIILYAVSTGLEILSFWLYTRTEKEPRSKLEKLKKKYLEQRKEILEKHQYKYSVYKGFKFAQTNEIYEEIMCDSFQADENGHVYIDISEDNHILAKPERITYHHITNNYDGHILSIREIRKFVKTGESQDENN